MSVYAPTKSDILSFYVNLKQVFFSIGGLNTRVGKDHQTWNCLGSHGIGNINSNGLQLQQFCNEPDLVIRNIVLTEKQVQGYMATNTFQKLAYDRLYLCCDLYRDQTMRGVDYWTDHHLVKDKLELKIRPKARHTTLLHPK